MSAGWVTAYDGCTRERCSTVSCFLDTKGPAIHTARTTHPELSSRVNRVRVEGRRAFLRCTMGSHAAGHISVRVVGVCSTSGVDAAGASGALGCLWQPKKSQRRTTSWSRCSMPAPNVEWEYCLCGESEQGRVSAVPHARQRLLPRGGHRAGCDWPPPCAGASAGARASRTRCR
jgi:hypothetical protein